MGPRHEPDVWLAVKPLGGRTCAFEGCDGEITAAEFQFERRPDDRWNYNVIWACALHAEQLDHPQLLAPICQIGRETPCGAVATHIALAGVREHPDGPLRAVSTCERHADEVGDQLDAGDEPPRRQSREW